MKRRCGSGSSCCVWVCCYTNPLPLSLLLPLCSFLPLLLILSVQKTEENIGVLPFFPHFQPKNDSPSLWKASCSNPCKMMSRRCIVAGTVSAKKQMYTTSILNEWKLRLDSNIDSKSLNNTYLNIIKILFLFLIFNFLYK